MSKKQIWFSPIERFECSLEQLCDGRWQWSLVTPWETFLGIEESEERAIDVTERNSYFRECEAAQ